MADVERGTEDDWFRRHEQLLLEEARRKREERETERQKHESAAERARLRELHWMKCPKCGHDLKSEDLSGVEIDRCTYCEGFFMDAGELEDLARRQEGERRGIVRRMLGI